MITRYYADVLSNQDVRCIFAQEDPEVGPPSLPTCEGECRYIGTEFAWGHSSDTCKMVWDGAAVTWVETASLDDLKARKNAEINDWRALANRSTFPHGGKLIACDALSRSDIDAVANHIGLFGAFPQGFPMAWKTTDNTYLPLPDVDAFKALYASMTEQGTANFDRSQDLKAELGNVSSAAEIAAIVW